MSMKAAKRSGGNSRLNTWKVREWVQFSVGEKRAHAKLHKVLSPKESQGLSLINHIQEDTAIAARTASYMETAVIK